MSLQNDPGRVGRWFGYGLTALGALTLAGLLLSRLFYAQVEPLMQWVLDNMVTASGDPALTRFAGPAMFYSYQFTHVLIFGVVTLASGVIFWWAGRTRWAQQAVPLRAGLSMPPLWQVAAVALVAADLMIASWGFNPASDPALLDFTPPAIQWLQAQDQTTDWRYMTLDDPSQPPILQANLGWSYKLRDVRGYESIIPKTYVDFMRQIAPQVQLDFNRVAPLYTDYGDIDFDYTQALESPLLDDLGVRFLITHKSTTLPERLTTPPGPRTTPRWTLVYEDEAVRIWASTTISLISYARRSRDLDLWHGDGAVEQRDQPREIHRTQHGQADLAAHQRDLYARLARLHPALGHRRRRSSSRSRSSRCMMSCKACILTMWTRALTPPLKTAAPSRPTTSTPSNVPLPPTMPSGSTV